MSLTVAEAKALQGTPTEVVVRHADAFPNEYRRTLHKLAEYTGDVFRGRIVSVQRLKHPEEDRHLTAAKIDGGDWTGWWLPRAIGGPALDFDALVAEIDDAGGAQRSCVASAAVLGDGFTEVNVHGIRWRVEATPDGAARVARSIVRAQRALAEGLAGQRNTVDGMRDAMRWLDEAVDSYAANRHRDTVAEDPALQPLKGVKPV